MLAINTDSNISVRPRGFNVKVNVVGNARGSVAKNILAAISSGKEQCVTSISSVDRKFLQHYPWDSEEDRYIVEVYDTYDLLLDLLSISSMELLNDLSGKLGDRNWCQRNPARLTEQEELYFNWEDFSEQLKHHAF